MDFELDTEQEALRDAVRGLLGAHTESAEARAADGWDRGLWKQLAEMGVLGLPFAEADGGAGAGPIEVMVVAEELGRALTPVPFLDSVVAAGQLVAQAGSREQRRTILGRLSDGEAVPVLAHTEPRTGWSNRAHGVSATPAGNGWSITGVKEPVPYGASADLLLVTARVSEETRVFVVEPDQPAVERLGYDTHDGSRAARVAFDGATATQLGDGEHGAPALDDVVVRVQAALCAEALGAMQQALDLSVDYLKTRKQFGVPLAKFQALTHRAADMYVSLELARSMSGYASMSLASHGPDPEVAARAKLQIGRSARHIGQEAIQLHGGIGMTAEYAVGRYVSRLVAIEHTLGSSQDQLRVLTNSVADHPGLDLLG